ncbi:nucleoside-triphosphatase [Paenibacillus sp. GCM10027626]|uniref:nucleoside-triphosphatase n=1 Tax=Paenibacillus sp. GCM10027626 TaxID=3273411 RepID=UPI0036293186
MKNLVKQIASDLCGGFYTEEIRDLNDRIGFKCVSVDGESQVIAHVDSPSLIRVGRYGVDIESFEKFAILLIEASLISKKVIVVDEIGFMQMLPAPFRKLINRILSENNRIVLGTIPVDSHPEIDKIRENTGVKIFSINEDNRDLIGEEMANTILAILERS